MTSQPNQQKCSEGTEVVSQLISLGLIDVNDYDDEGFQPLHIAVKNDKPLLAKFLIQNGADVNVRTIYDGETPLAMAVQLLLPEMVELLLQHNAITYGNSALWIADSDCIMWTQYMLEKKSKILDLIFQHGLKSGNTSLITYHKLCKAIRNDDFRSINRLIKFAKDINFKDIKVESPLEFAIHLNKFEAVELLLKKGADPNRESDFEQSPLVVAMQENNPRMVEILLKFKTNVNISINSDSIVTTAVNIATTDCDIGILKLLLDHGAEVDGFGDRFLDETPLHSACRDTLDEEAKLLLKYGAKVNAKNSRGQTPLLLACRANEDLKIIELLLEYGADVTAVDDKCKTVLHYVGKNYKLSIVKFVIGLALERDININVTNKYGKAPYNNVRCRNVVEFLKNGANLNIQCHDGNYEGHNCSNAENESWCVAFEYVARLKFLGYKIINPFYKDIHVSNDLLELYRQELNKLKSQVIVWNPKRTLYDVLFMSRDDLVRYSANENLKAVSIECNSNLESKYPYFGSVLNLQLRRGIGRKNVSSAAKTNLQKVFGIGVSEICSNMIFKYVEDFKFKEFAKAVFE